MKKRIFVLGIIFATFSASIFAQIYPATMEIKKDKVEKWVYELFVKQNERYVRNNFKIVRDEKIFYGAANGKNLTYVRLVAEQNAYNACNKAICDEAHVSVYPTALTTLDLVSESSVTCSDDEGNQEIQVFCLYKISNENWEATLKDAKEIQETTNEFKQSVKDSLKGAWKSFSDSVKNALNEMEAEIQESENNSDNSNNGSINISGNTSGAI